MEEPTKVRASFSRRYEDRLDHALGGINLAGRHVVHVAPHPVLTRLDGAHQRVLGGMEMLARVLVLRRIATADMSTDKAEAQMDPGIADLHAIFADVLIGSGDFDLIGMFALHTSTS